MSGLSVIALCGALALAGCSGNFAIDRPSLSNVIPPTGATTIVEPNGQVIEEPTVAGMKTVIEPNGQVIEEPVATLSPIESTITSLSQAQTLRTLVRQLAR